MKRSNYWDELCATAIALETPDKHQIAIPIPTSLANGDYAVVATVGTAQSPSTTLITVQN